MNDLRRLLSWVLGGLAVGVAARALISRRSPDEVVPGAAVRSSEPLLADSGDDSVFISPIVPMAHEFPYEEQPQARWQTGTAMARVLAARLKAHTTTIIAGSLAYYALLAMFPAAIAGISVYGLVADPEDLTSLITTLAERLPATTATLIEEELGKIVSGSDAGLGIATVLGILVALWSASAGTKVLITGVNLAYGERENRSFFVLRGLALMLTIGMVIGVVVVVAGVAVLPKLVESSLTNIVRWPALILLVVAGLAALYRIAPSDAPGRNHPIWQGALVASLVWLAATAGFSAGVTAFNFGGTYGTLAGVVVLLVWFFLSGLVVLLGAEFNAAIETRRNRLANARG